MERPPSIPAVKKAQIVLSVLAGEMTIATRRPAEYDAAVALLTDLQALAERDGRPDGFTQRSWSLRQTHARKPSLIERLDRASV